MRFHRCRLQFTTEEHASQLPLGMHAYDIRKMVINGKDLGHGVFARCPIKKGTLLCYYMGEVIKVEQQMEESNYTFQLLTASKAVNPFAATEYWVDSKDYFTISGLFQHLPAMEDVPVIKGLTSSVQFENLFLKSITLLEYGGIQVVGAIAMRDIKAGEQLGFTYGLNFWVTRIKAGVSTYPILFDVKGGSHTAFYDLEDDEALAEARARFSWGSEPEDLQVKQLTTTFATLVRDTGSLTLAKSEAYRRLQNEEAPICPIS